MTGIRRPARADDLEAVHAIYTDPSVVPYLTYEALDLAAFRPVFDDLLAGGNVFVFEVDGVVAGFYRATRLRGRGAHVVHVGPLAVAAGFQGRGVGRAMLLDMLAWLERAGVLRVELQAEADNARGLAFYRALGFSAEGVQRLAYKRAGDGHFTDEVMMVRFLGDLAPENPSA